MERKNSDYSLGLVYSQFSEKLDEESIQELVRENISIDDNEKTVIETYNMKQLERLKNKTPKKSKIISFE